MFFGVDKSELLTLAHWNAAPGTIGCAGGCLIPNQGERRDTLKLDGVQEMRDVSRMEGTEREDPKFRERGRRTSHSYKSTAFRKLNLKDQIIAESEEQLLMTKWTRVES